GPDLAGVSPARIAAEAAALALLAQRLPEEHRARVPAPIWHDEENNILWTEQIAPGAASLQSLLEAGQCDPAAAGETGRLLGAVHAAGVGEVPPLWPTPEEDDANWHRFLRMRTTGFIERAGFSRVAELAARTLYWEARERERRGMLSHLDAAPKNVLVASDGHTALLDFELGAAVSDPAYDPGFLAGHYLLMGENHPPMREAARAAALRLAAGYRSTAPDLDPEWEQRFWRYAGLTLVYRIHGSSPAPYLHPQRFEAIREAGFRLLLAGQLG
ncbi:MAG TPA: phosphotransferase, partial [Armatimonadota bacterium]|nr:phosphotransferase [Armatimonadota bacterium]